MDPVTIFLYVGVSFLSIVIIAAIFRWVLGIGKLIKVSERQYFLLKTMAREKGIPEETLKDIEVWGDQTNRDKAGVKPV